MTYPWRQLYLLVCGELASKRAIEQAARRKTLLLDSGRTRDVRGTLYRDGEVYSEGSQWMGWRKYTDGAGLPRKLGRKR